VEFVFSCPTIEDVIDVMRKKEYAVFERPSGHDLNLVGIRAADTRSNRFNDWLTVFYRFRERWNFFAFPATTDPGLHYRLEPTPQGEGQPQGVAILKPGQYRGAYKIGKHRNKYKALTQRKEITVYRDPDKNATLDVQEGRAVTGFFGINIHRANESRPSVQVDKWSAGCQVLQDPDHFAFLLTLCERQRRKFQNGDAFTYTLLQEQDFS
jgi:hypothetical protein